MNGPSVGAPPTRARYSLLAGLSTLANPTVSDVGEKDSDFHLDEHLPEARNGSANHQVGYFYFE